jgi:hypothetical protein
VDPGLALPPTPSISTPLIFSLLSFLLQAPQATWCPRRLIPPPTAAATLTFIPGAHTLLLLRLPRLRPLHRFSPSLQLANHKHLTKLSPISPFSISSSPRCIAHRPVRTPLPLFASFPAISPTKPPIFAGACGRCPRCRLLTVGCW